jgi:putative membrane protein
MMWDGMMGIGMLLWWLIGIALLVLLVLGIVWLIRQLGSPGKQSTDGDALRELELRYARGDIDRDTYLAMRDDLRA